MKKGRGGCIFTLIPELSSSLLLCTFLCLSQGISSQHISQGKFIAANPNRSQPEAAASLSLAAKGRHNKPTQ
jgi:hypothetical protein